MTLVAGAGRRCTYTVCTYSLYIYRVYTYLHTYLLTSTHLCIPDSMLMVKSAFECSAARSAWLTASHPNSVVKQVQAGVVLRWGTTREGPVLRFLSHLPLSASFQSSHFR